MLEPVPLHLRRRCYRPPFRNFVKAVLLTEVVVLMSALLFADLQTGRPQAADAAALASECGRHNARVNYDLAIPNPESDDSYYLSFFLDEQAGDFMEKIKDLDGVLSIYVKSGVELP